MKSASLSVEDRTRAFETALRKAVRGDVRFDAVTRGIHATDASHYQVMPMCVVWPVDADDAAAALRLAHEHEVAITPRGAGTSLSGQTMWHGMILDFSRYMDRVLEVDAEAGWVRAQPGVIRDQLNKQLTPTGLHFPPDPATSNRATVGGMMANNSSGTRSIIYGKTSDYVLELKVALTDGTIITLRPHSRDEWRAVAEGEGREAEIYAGFEKVIQANRDEIAKRYSKVMRRVAGYALDAFDDSADTWNLAQIILGSEGTLCVVLEAKLRLVPVPRATAVCAVHFHTLTDSLRGVGPILEHAPAAVELLDELVLTEAVRNRTTAHLTDFVEGKPGAMLLVEVFGEDQADATHRIEKLAADLAERGVGYSWPVRSDAAGQKRIWDVRKLGLGLISNQPGARKGQAFIEDACVPVEVLPDYIDKVLAICKEHDTPVTLYAHASVGVLHVRPILDLHVTEDVAKMQSIANAAFKVVQEYNGVWSGEHGDGLVRGMFIKPYFGDQIYEAFREVKRLFDPKGLMNPGKIVDVPPMTENLRYGEEYRLAEVPATSFHHREQGGFALAVEQCNGVGACRKLDAGTMCPSYMATRDEAHSTRGRANALRLAMTGQLGKDALASDGVHETLELCLSCKACKSECPNGVDMAKLKGDALQLRHDKFGVPIGTRMMATLPRVAPWFVGPLSHLINPIQRSGLARWMGARFGGVDARRSLPPFARESLTRWFGKRSSPRESDRPEVVLFDDTFANYFEPGVGKAAVQLLEACGYRVLLAAAGCCQRPAISKGMLREARRHGEATLRNLDVHAKAGRPILTLEPSCASALTEDLPDLIDDVGLGQRIAAHVQPMESFLAAEIEAGRLTGRFRAACEQVLLHGHCHQKAGPGTAAIKRVLSEVEGLNVQEIDSGCCGMAGSFGYEHYDLSLKIGEDRLFPAVRNRPKGAAVIASGTSCRHQLHDGCDVEAKHWVELLSYEK
ncbi:MAG: FAD-linked oxidase C-terminal domain-containing protein [Phycisphaeraceae bacterium]